MNCFVWALLSAIFAGLTAILAKVGVASVNSNLATAISESYGRFLCFPVSAIRFPKSAYHSITALAQVSPPPKTTRRT
jgi:transporter family protein